MFADPENDQLWDDQWTEYHRLVEQIVESVPRRVDSADAAHEWLHKFPKRWVRWFYSYLSGVVY